MDWRSAQRTVLVRAVEESPGGESWLDEAARVSATREVAGIEDDVEFLEARARLLAPVVAGEGGEDGVPGHGGAGPWVAGRSWRWGVVGVLLLAFGAGVAADRLGGGGRVINLLGVPVFAVVGWNLVVYALKLVRWWAGRRAGAGLAPPLLVGWWLGRAGGGNGRPGGGVAAEVDRRYRQLWYPVAAPRLAAGAGALLNLAAAVVALGVVAGIYGRGIAFEYAATFESTFLSAEAAQRVLGTVLAPASWVTGVAVPEVAGVATKADTARWIHLLAATLALFVVVPRTAMALAGWWRWRAAGRDVRPGPGGGWAGYAESCRKAARGGGTVVAVVPHAGELDTKQREAVRALATSEWGGAVVVEFATAVAYGEEAEAGRVLPEAAADGGPVVAHFGLASTPEEEVQGALLRALAGAAGGEIVVALDAAPFVARFGKGGGAGHRFEERCRAWGALAKRHKMKAFSLSADGPRSFAAIPNPAAGAEPARTPTDG